MIRTTVAWRPVSFLSILHLDEISGLIHDMYKSCSLSIAFESTNKTHTSQVPSSINTSTMRFTPSTILIFSAFAIAAPNSPIESRQVEWHAVGELYSGGGCTSQSFIFADPIWGAANTCHPLDRSGNVPPITSYKAVSIDSGCTGKSSLELEP